MDTNQPQSESSNTHNSTDPNITQEPPLHQPHSSLSPAATPFIPSGYMDNTSSIVSHSPEPSSSATATSPLLRSDTQSSGMKDSALNFQDTSPRTSQPPPSSPSRESAKPEEESAKAPTTEQGDEDELPYERDSDSEADIDLGDDPEMEEVRAQGRQKALLAELLAEIDDACKPFKIMAPSVERAKAIAERLTEIPPGHVPHRTDGSQLQCALQTIADLFSQVPGLHKECPVCLQKVRQTLQKKLLDMIDDPEEIRRRNEGVASAVGMTMEDFLNDPSVSALDRQFIDVQQMITLLESLFRQAELDPETNGFRLHVVQYDRALKRVTSVYSEGIPYGSATHEFWIRHNNDHFEAYYEETPAGEVSDNGRAIQVTEFMAWGNPVYNGGVVMNHVCGPKAVEELRDHYFTFVKPREDALAAARAFDQTRVQTPNQRGITEDENAAPGASTQHPPQASGIKPSLREETPEEKLDGVTTKLGQAAIHHPIQQSIEPAAPPAKGKGNKRGLGSPTEPDRQKRQSIVRLVQDEDTPHVMPPKAPRERSATAHKPSKGPTPDARQQRGLVLDGLTIPEAVVLAHPEIFINLEVPVQIKILQWCVAPGEVHLPIAQLPLALRVTSLEDPAAAARFRELACGLFLENTFFTPDRNQAQIFFNLLATYAEEFHKYLPSLVKDIRVKPRQLTIRKLEWYTEELRVVRSNFHNALVMIEIPTSPYTTEAASGKLSQPKDPKPVPQFTAVPAKLFRDTPMPIGRKS